MNAINFSHVTLDMEQLKYLERVFFQNTTCGACTNVLSHYLLPERKLQFIGQKKEINISESDADMWDVFASDVFRQMLCFGFVMFTIDDVRCLSLKEVNMLQFDPVTKEIFAVNNPLQKKQKQVYIVNAFGTSPLYDGTITSVMAKVAPEIEFLQALHRHALTIETQKINPDVYCETVNRVPLKKEIRHYDDFRFNESGVNYDAGTAPDRTSHFQYSLKEKKAVMNEYELQQNVLNRMQRDVDDEQRNDAYNIERLRKRLKTPKQNFHALPPDVRINKVFSTTARQDLVQISRMIEQKICAVMGVPRSMLINDSVARADTEATHDCFRVTLKRYRKNVAHALSVAASLVFSESINIILPDSYHGPTEELLKFYILGVISFETYAHTVQNMYNLSLDEHVITEPLDETQRKELVMACMQSMVTQHHGRT